jgi:hypothetical protein
MQRAIANQTKTFATNAEYHGEAVIQLNPNRRMNQVFTKFVRIT